jgi:hypothetical protein
MSNPTTVPTESTFDGQFELKVQYYTRKLTVTHLVDTEGLGNSVAEFMADGRVQQIFIRRHRVAAGKTKQR